MDHDVIVEAMPLKEATMEQNRATQFMQQGYV